MMEECKTKILVVTHKPDKVYSDNVYIPIQVGKVLSHCDLGFQGDDTGDNISEKNPIYWELTAQYWAWKNLKDVEYIGLCHYRRYFKTKYTEDNVIPLLQKYDIILPEPIYYPYSIEQKLYRAAIEEDVAILCQVIEKLYPEYKKSVLAYLYNNMDIAFNMFVCSKKIFDEFAEWQFSILFECEKYIRFSSYSRARRILGHFAEYLLPIYCFHHCLKIKYEPLVSFIGENKMLYKQNFVKKNIFRLVHKIVNLKKKKNDWNISSVILQGLKIDNVVIK